MGGCAHTTALHESASVKIETSLRDEHTVKVEYFTDGSVKKFEVSRDDTNSDDFLKTITGYAAGIFTAIGF